VHQPVANLLAFEAAILMSEESDLIAIHGLLLTGT
jgi:hypothetical protein